MNINNQKGVASIEFAYIIIPVFLIFYLGFDISFYIQTKGDIDQINYSLNTLASNPELWAKDSNGNIVEGLQNLDVQKYQHAAAALLKLNVSDYNRVGVKLSYVTETDIEHKQAGNCSISYVAGVNNVVDLLGPKIPGETGDRKVMVMHLCYRPKHISFAQNILNSNLLPNEIDSHSLLIQR